MDSFSPIQQYLGYLCTALLLPQIWTIHRRGQQKTFPVFFAYLLIVLIKSEVLQLIKPFSRTGYFYGYWLAEAITILLSLAVIYEIYRNILTSGTLPTSKTTFFRINVGLLLLASMVAIFTVHTGGDHPLLRTIFVFGGALRTMQLGMFLLLAWFSIFFGFYWTSQAFGIALGYALYALAQLANTLARAWVGPLGNQVYEYVTILAYMCAVLIWIAYAQKDEKGIGLNAVPENTSSVWFGALERLAK